jgi:molybdenum-dependent DNA-binding transcriptional regulator ModE
MSLDPRDLRYFAVVAEHGNLRRAAEALDLSQPGLSKCLRRLERAAGWKLVRRTPKGVELTDFGSVLLTHAKRLKLYLDDVEQEVAALGQGRAGHLRIGVIPGYDRVGGRGDAPNAPRRRELSQGRLPLSHGAAVHRNPEGNGAGVRRTKAVSRKTREAHTGSSFAEGPRTQFKASIGSQVIEVPTVAVHTVANVR